MLDAGSSPRAWGTLRKVSSSKKTDRFIPTCVGNTANSVRSFSTSSVHPHVRGEHELGEGDIGQVQRFIPTCVGNTRQHAHGAPPVAVHPHVRGEHGGNQFRGGGMNGSSPRAWGTRRAGRRARGRRRFIPTCVGNTCERLGVTMTAAVHPHVRGEHDTSAVPGTGFCGSSPRAWGTRERVGLDRDAVRFIPTCVGNTRPILVSGTVKAVHPHVRGEHFTVRLDDGREFGSSPRAWGTPCQRQSPQSRGRFIPTCVGNTWHGTRWAGALPVHPHVRGEHRASRDARQSAGGSSPRAWGTPGAFLVPQACGRFIPTCVGNTKPALPPYSQVEVHPHVRGEHCESVGVDDLVAGSSPRAWGTRCAGCSRAARSRFIPTCVGNTRPSRTASPSMPVHPHVRGEHTFSNSLIFNDV